MRNESEAIQGLIALSRKFRGYATNPNAADPPLMMALSVSYIQEAGRRFRKATAEKNQKVQNTACP